MKNLQPQQIIALLEPSSPPYAFDIEEFQATGSVGENHSYSRKSKVRREASIKSLLEVLRISDDDSIHTVICEILGWRKAISAIPAMVEYLDSDSESLRYEAADSLGKIGSPKAGPPLLEHFKTEKSVMVKTTLALSLGRCQYKPAAEYLVKCLTHSDDNLRGFSALALGWICAREYLPDLQKLAKTESDPMVIHRVNIAIAAIENCSEE